MVNFTHTETSTLVDVRNLCVDYVTFDGKVRAVNNVSFHINRGEYFGLGR